MPRGRGKNPLLFVQAGIIDLDVEHKAVELCFGKRIGSFLLDRVLRGDGEKRIGQGISRLTDRHFPFLHRLQERGLGFGGCPIDFVSEQDIREHRSFDEAEAASAMFVFFQHVRARDVRGHEVGRELDAFEIEVKNLRQRANHQSLRQPRHAFEQTVAPRENGGKDLFDDFVLTDDDLLQLLLHDQPMLTKVLENVA